MSSQHSVNGHARWEAEFSKGVVGDATIHNRSGIAVHTRHLLYHVPGAQLVPAPAHRAWRSRRLQPARQGDARAGRVRLVAHSMQLGVPWVRRRQRTVGIAWYVRNGHQPRGRHAGRPRRRAHRRSLHGHERPFALHAAGVRAGGGQASRRALDQDHGHLKPERLHLALRREPHVLPPGAAGRATGHRGSHRVREQARAGLEPLVHRRAAHATGRRDPGRGHGLHALFGHPVRGRLHRQWHGPGPVPPALHVLLRCLGKLI